MSSADIAIRKVQTAINGRRLQLMTLATAVVASYLALAAAFLNFGLHPVFVSIGALLAILVTYRLRKQLVSPKKTELDAAALLDKELICKDRFSTYTSLSSKADEVTLVARAIVLYQLGPYVTKLSATPLPVPLILSTELKRFLYSLPVVWLTILTLIFLNAPTMSPDPRVSAIQRLLEEHVDLPEAVKKELTVLKDLLNESNTSTSEIAKALERSRNEIDRSKAELDSSRTVEQKGSDDAQAEQSQSDTTDSSSELSPADLAKKQPQLSASKEPVPTATPTPTPTPTLLPKQKDQKKDENKQDVDVQNSVEKKGEPKEKPDEKKDSKSNEQGGGGKGDSKSKDQKDNGQSGSSSSEGKGSGEGKDGSNEQEGAGQGKESKGKSGESKGSKSDSEEGKDQKEDDSKKQSGKSGSKSQQEKSLDVAEKTIDELQKELNKGSDGQKKNQQDANGKDKGSDESKEGEENRNSAPSTQGGPQNDGKKENADKANEAKSDGGEKDEEKGKEAKQPDQSQTDGKKQGKDSKNSEKKEDSNPGDKGAADKGRDPEKGELPPQMDSQSKRQQPGQGPPRDTNDGKERGYKDSTIEDKSESYDSRFTGKDSSRELNSSNAQSKTTLADVTLARPSSSKDRNEQLIPPEYKDQIR